MQDPDPEGGMGVVLVRFGLLVGGTLRVGVDVHVPLPVVLMFMGVDAEGFAQGPEADPKQHYAHDPLAPRGEQIHRQQITQPQGE